MERHSSCLLDITTIIKQKWLVSTILQHDFFVGRVLRLRRNMHWQDIASFDGLLSLDGLWHLGKGRIVRGTTTRRLPPRLTGSSTQAGTGCTDIQALTRHT